MEAPSVVLVSRATRAVPKDYTIPAAQEIAPLIVRADIDGSGAAGQFEPTLQVLSPAGDVISSVPASTVAAGGSASVTWAPFLRAPVDTSSLAQQATVYGPGTVAGYLAQPPDPQIYSGTGTSDAGGPSGYAGVLLTPAIQAGVTVTGCVLSLARAPIGPLAPPNDPHLFVGICDGAFNVLAASADIAQSIVGQATGPFRVPFISPYTAPVTSAVYGLLVGQRATNYSTTALFQTTSSLVPVLDKLPNGQFQWFRLTSNTAPGTLVPGTSIAAIVATNVAGAVAPWIAVY